MYAVPIEDSRFGQLQRCTCTVQADADRQTVRQQQHLATLVNELGALSDCTFASFDTERPLVPLVWREHHYTETVQRLMLRRALETAQRYAAAARGWCYLYGAFGSGKSHLAAAIAHTLAAAGRQVLYRSVPALLDGLRSGYRDGSFDARLAAACTVDGLVLDDLGSEHLTDSAESLLFQLLNERDRYDRTTILTANVDPADVPGRLGSRIDGRAQARVWLPVSDFRKIRFQALRAAQRQEGGRS